MNYSKLLLCALLAVSSACFAMEKPIESQIDQQLQLLINSGIDGNSDAASALKKQNYWRAIHCASPDAVGNSYARTI